METAPAIPSKVKIGFGDSRIWIGAFIVLLFIAIGYYFYKQGKKTVTIAPLPTDDPAKGGSSNSVGDSEISRIATNLHDDMKGLNVFASHDETPYNNSLALSDTDFVKLYNFFNTKYEVESSQTLTEWIVSEYSIPYSPYATILAAMQQRLGKLNLK